MVAYPLSASLTVSVNLSATAQTPLQEFLLLALFLDHARQREAYKRHEAHWACTTPNSLASSAPSSSEPSQQRQPPARGAGMQGSGSRLQLRDEAGGSCAVLKPPCISQQRVAAPSQCRALARRGARQLLGGGLQEEQRRLHEARAQRGCGRLVPGVDPCRAEQGLVGTEGALAIRAGGDRHRAADAAGGERQPRLDGPEAGSHLLEAKGHMRQRQAALMRKESRGRGLDG